MAPSFSLPIAIAPKPHLSSCGWWAHKITPSSHFGLSLAGLLGLRILWRCQISQLAWDLLGDPPEGAGVHGLTWRSDLRIFQLRPSPGEAELRWMDEWIDSLQRPVEGND